MIRVVFMGSSEFACRSFEALLNDPVFDTVLAITQPDRPKGRSLKVLPCPARAAASSKGVRVISPARLNTDEVFEELKALNADFFCVVAYGHILRDRILGLPRCGCINVHASLLPRYRGAAPIQWAVASGDQVTGVTTMHMDKGMDEGDIIYSLEEHITPMDTGGTLHDRLALKGAGLLVKTLKDVYAGTAPRKAQNHAEATYAPKLTKDDGKIDWKETATVIYNKSRAFNPWPGSWFQCGDALANRVNTRIKVYGSVVLDGKADPGVVIAADPCGIDVGTSSGILRITELQAEGGRRLGVGDFITGHNILTGRRFA